MKLLKSATGFWWIGVLGFLIFGSFGYFAYVHTLSKDYYQTITKVQQLELLDRDIKLFLSSRIGRTSFDDIVSQSQMFEQTMSQTKDLVAQHSNPELIRLFDKIEKIYNKQKELIESHKANTALVNNSIRYLYDVKITLESNPHLRFKHAELDAILYGFMELIMDGDTDNDSLTSKIHLLEEEFEKNKIEEIGYFVLHSKVILSKLEDLKGVSQNTKEDTLAKELEMFLSKYNADYTKRQGYQEYLFLALAVLCIGLLVLLAYHIQKEEEVKGRLRGFTEELESRVAQEVTKNREKDKMMMHQSRLVAMGEMIGNIAHQWRQPLNALGLIIQNLKFDFEDGLLDKKTIDTHVDKADSLVQNMSKTIDDFRNFFKPSKAPQDFSLTETMNSVASMMLEIYRSNDVDIDVRIADEVVVHGFAGEFAQAILNILANAKDAIKAKHIANGKVTIEVSKRENYAAVAISDNGGGVSLDIIDNIFEPYFTTKHKAQGVGIGLYMTKNIIETNMGGTITVENIDGGTRFIIEVPTNR